MSYVIEFADTIGKEDTVFEEKGIKIIVDPKCLLYIDGTEIDFGKENASSQLKIEGQIAKLKKQDLIDFSAALLAISTEKISAPCKVLH